VRDAYIARATLFRRANATRSAQWFDEQGRSPSPRANSGAGTSRIVCNGQMVWCWRVKALLDVSTATLSFWARNQIAFRRQRVDLRTLAGRSSCRSQRSGRPLWCR